MKINNFLVKIKNFNLIENINKFISTIKYYLIGLYKKIDYHDWFLWGGGIAFSIFLCLFPFIFILFAILGNLLDSQKVTEQIIHIIDTAIPYKEYADYAKKIILNRVEEMVKYKNTAAVIGGIGLFITASGLFSAMRTVLNSIFGIEKEKSILVAKLRDFGMVLLLIVFIFLLTFVLPLLRFLFDLADKLPVLEIFKLGTLLNTVFSITSLLIIFSLFYTFYYLIPYTKISKAVAALSAFWATFLWDAARRLFGYYIYNFADYGKIYGTYTLIIVVALWIYYSSILFVLGAEIGQLYRERKLLKPKNKRFK